MLVSNTALKITQDTADEKDIYYSSFMFHCFY